MKLETLSLEYYRSVVNQIVLTPEAERKGLVGGEPNPEWFKRYDEDNARTKLHHLIKSKAFIVTIKSLKAFKGEMRGLKDTEIDHIKAILLWDMLEYICINKALSARILKEYKKGLIENKEKYDPDYAKLTVLPFAQDPVFERRRQFGMKYDEEFKVWFIGLYFNFEMYFDERLESEYDGSFANFKKDFALDINGIIELIRNTENVDMEW